MNAVRFIRPPAADSIVIERSFDYPLIKQLVCDPAIFPHVSDDFFKTPEEWSPIEDEQICYLLARDPESYFGFGVFMPQTKACYRGHFGFLPRSYGTFAIESFRRMLHWMWSHTEARRIVGEICSDNRIAIQFAVRAGGSVYGVNQKSRLRGGEMRDQVCVGISKP